MGYVLIAAGIVLAIYGLKRSKLEPGQRKLAYAVAAGVAAFGLALVIF